jgi:hypothetical protein
MLHFILKLNLFLHHERKGKFPKEMEGSIQMYAVLYLLEENILPVERKIQHKVQLKAVPVHTLKAYRAVKV